MRIDLGIVCLLMFFTSCEPSVKEEFYPDGSLKLKAEMGDGKRDGLALEFSPEGSLVSRSEWKNGVAHGTTTEYYTNGKVKIISTWLNGKENGESKRYTEDGYLYSVGKYIRSKRQFVNIYHKNGEVLERQLFNNDERLIYVSRYDSSGNKEYSMIPPIFEFQSDTISLGETYKVTIKFGVPLGGQLSVLVGTLDSAVSLLDTTAILESKDKIYTYSLKPEKTGRIIIPFLFNHRPAEGDTIDINGMLTKHNFYVIDKSTRI